MWFPSATELPAKYQNYNPSTGCGEQTPHKYNTTGESSWQCIAGFHMLISKTKEKHGDSLLSLVTSGTTQVSHKLTGERRIQGPALCLAPKQETGFLGPNKVEESS